MHDTPVLSSVNLASKSRDVTSATAGSSSSDSDTDMDTGSDFRMAFSQSPEPPSPSWRLNPSPIRKSRGAVDDQHLISSLAESSEMALDHTLTSSTLGNLRMPFNDHGLACPPLRNPRMAIDGRGARISTPIIASVAGPQHSSVQDHGAQGGPSVQPTASRSHLGFTMERFPSPISEDEPHTPTTATGSQLSLLTMTDVDMDMEASEPTSQPEVVTVRKQRQRSGAFISPREPSKKFIMGYREDCDKCRDRVPGHMNHFLGS